MSRVTLVGVIFVAAACKQSPAASAVKIVDGQTVVRGDDVAKSTVALIIRGTGQTELCTGTLIGARQVVTAAHCVDGRPIGSITVVFSLNADPAKGGVVRHVVGMARHPNFDNFAAAKAANAIKGVAAATTSPAAPIDAMTQDDPGDDGQGVLPGPVLGAGTGRAPGGSDWYPGTGPFADPLGGAVDPSAGSGSAASSNRSVTLDPTASGTGTGTAVSAPVKPVGDIGVIVLDSPAPTGFAPVGVGSPDTLVSGTQIILAGYGATSQAQDGRGTLRQTTARVDHICAGSGEKDPTGCSAGEFIQANEGKGTCNGDSGGPVFVDDGSGLQVVGATSRGSNCDKGNGTYTFVSLYQGWMKCAFAKLGQPLAGLADDASASDCDATQISGGSQG